MGWTRRFRRRLKKKLQTAKKPRKVHLEALEPRILLSSDPLSYPAAAGPAAVAAVDLEDDDGTDPLLLIDSAGQSSLIDGALDPQRAVDLAAGAAAVDVSASDDAVIASPLPASMDSGRQIAFVERGAADPRALIDAAGPADGPGSVSNLEVVTIDSDGDGIAQITDYLLDARDIAAIHVFSHGASGSLQLGGARLDSDALDAYATQLAVWGEALAEDADILLYGCSVADGRQGAAFVKDLAARTGADIAASTDLSGSANLGGDWDLEFETGSIEATVVPLAQNDFLLAASTDISLDNASVDENLAAGTAVGSFTATDADTGDTHTFALVDDQGEYDNSSFQIVGSQLQTAAVFDCETQDSYSIQVQATDSTGSTFEKEFSITVGDVNEGPPAFPAATTVSIAENYRTAFTAAAIDPDSGDTLTYTISGGADQALFQINATTGVVSFKTGPDYENPIDADAGNTYEVEVTATDAGGLTDVLQQTVNVDDDTSEPFITATGDVVSGENVISPVTVWATHPNPEYIDYLLSGEDADLFVIDDDSAKLSFLSPPDYENPADSDGDNFYHVTVTVVDTTDLGRHSRDFTIDVRDNPSEPTIDSNAVVSVEENSLYTGLTVTATNPSGGDLSFSIVESLDDDGALFEIDPSTGALDFKSRSDFESPLDLDADNAYQLRVAAIDGSDLGTGYQDLTVTVTDKSNEPTITSDSAVTIDENTTAVLTVTYTIPGDGGNNVAYAVSGPDGDYFTIDDSGNLSFLSAPDYETPLDYDGLNDYEVTVTVTNEDDLGQDSQDITVTVANVSVGLTQSKIDNAGNCIPPLGQSKRSYHRLLDYLHGRFRDRDRFRGRQFQIGARPKEPD